MTEKYHEMWKELNIALEPHEKMLKGMGKITEKIFKSQKNRPQGMAYFDEMLDEIHSKRPAELKSLKDMGKKIIGIFCVFVPEEIILALDAVLVGLCAGAEVGFPDAEKILPRNTCALIKSFVGFKMTRLSPYMQLCDLMVGETTCDGKKKAYELFSEYAPMFVMEIPQMKNPADKELWKKEILRFKDKMEEMTGNKLQADKLIESINIVNNKREALKRLDSLRANIPSPISGRDSLLINQMGFYDDPTRFTEQVNLLCDELEGKIKSKAEDINDKTPRILMAGCPMALPNWKVPLLTESLGAVIVGEEACVGSRNTRNLVETLADEENPHEKVDNLIDRLAERYLSIDCACFSPNSDRMDHIIEMAKELKADGIINYNLSFCQPYNIEAFKLERELDKRESEVPLLTIETDYGMQDREQLKTRIQAFLEMIRK